MNREWIENKTNEHMQKIEHLKSDIVSKISECDIIPDNKKCILLDVVDQYESEPYRTANEMILALQILCTMLTWKSIGLIILSTKL